VTAIGPDTLFDTLTSSPGFVDFIRARAETFGTGVGYAVQDVDLPAYAGSVNLRHGRVEPSPGVTSSPAASAVPGTGTP
jgi:hypothetical protein